VSLSTCVQLLLTLHAVIIAVRVVCFRSARVKMNVVDKLNSFHIIASGMH
jgi:hypothetical protein